MWMRRPTPKELENETADLMRMVRQFSHMPLLWPKAPKQGLP
jgi:hypothetical protein